MGEVVDTLALHIEEQEADTLVLRRGRQSVRTRQKIQSASSAYDVQILAPLTR